MSRRPQRNGRDFENAPTEGRIAPGNVQVSASKLADLAVCLWRVHRRASKTLDLAEPVLMACESAMDRLAELGVEITDMTGQPYHDNLRVNIVEQEGDVNQAIASCLSPAVFVKGELIKLADVTLKNRSDQ